MANDIYNAFGVSSNDYEYDPVTDTIKRKSDNFKDRWNLPVAINADVVGSINNVPTMNTVDPNHYLLPVEKVSFQKSLIELDDNRIIRDFETNKGTRFFNKLFGSGDEERFATWPERMVVSGATLPGDVYSGRTLIETDAAIPGALPRYYNDVELEPRAIPKALGMGKFTVPGPESVIARAQDTSGMAGMGSLGLAPAGTVTAGPSLRPALKYQGKLYKGKEGQQHADVIPESIYPEFQRQAMSGEDISNFNFGFVNHKGHFLNREQALEYAVNEGLMLPGDAKFGALTSTMFNENRAGTALGAVNNSGFYSNLERVVSGSKVAKGTPEQWEAYLRNQPGIKPEELEFSLGGLDKGKSYTKAEIEQHIGENGTKIGEVWKGDKLAPPQLLEWDTQARRLEAEGDLEGARAIRNEIVSLKSDGIGRPKYSSYQLPGGDNYRELLLTVPETPATKISFDNWFKEKYPTGNLDEFKKVPEEVQAVVKREYNNDMWNANKGNNYKSSHWDEPNVLAHIRMNDRYILDTQYSVVKNGDWYNIVDKNGTVQDLGSAGGKFGSRETAKSILQDKNLKTLHIEEIQSDWHQAGRKSGYNRLSSTEKKELDDLTFRETVGRETLPNNDRARIEELEAKAGEIPNAPFKKTWDELALKRSITEAVKNGYDAISWTPGEAQAARYDLSKQVDKLEFTHNRDMAGDLVAVDKNGREVIRKRITYPKKELPDIVGKEVAEKLLSDSADKGNGFRQLLNADLKVGGEGMKAFYDKMLVDKANALVKKMGGKVEYQEVPVVQDKYHANYDPNNKSQKIPIIRITPEMKKQIAERGFPLYSAGVPTFSPVEDDPFKRKPKLVPVQGNPFQ